MKRVLTILVIGGKRALYVNESLVTDDSSRVLVAAQEITHRYGDVVLSPAEDWTGLLTEFPADKRALPARGTLPNLDTHGAKPLPVYAGTGEVGQEDPTVRYDPGNFKSYEVEE